jgi:hypothetical protein
MAWAARSSVSLDLHVLGFSVIAAFTRITCLLLEGAFAENIRSHRLTIYGCQEITAMPIQKPKSFFVSATGSATNGCLLVAFTTHYRNPAACIASDGATRPS